MGKRDVDPALLASLVPVDETFGLQGSVVASGSADPHWATRPARLTLDTDPKDGKEDNRIDMKVYLVDQ